MIPALVFVVCAVALVWVAAFWLLRDDGSVVRGPVCGVCKTVHEEVCDV